MSISNRVVALTLWVAARNGDITSIPGRQGRGELETRVISIIKHKELGVGGVSQPSFDAVDILLDLDEER